VALPELVHPLELAPPETGGGAIRRRELAAFVRSRRERLRPEDVGLPRSRRRRTPGLRREEVAHLAAIGVTWYTWLEQGREINPSPQVLESIARTLRLDSHERNHLLTLAGLPTAPPLDDCARLFPTATAIIDQLEPNPACVMNARLDVIAYNRTYGSFFPDLESLPRGDRNCLWLAFTHPEWQRAIVDWDDTVSQMVAEYRSGMAEHLDDPAWQSLVDRLLASAPEFETYWARHDVRPAEAKSKRARHPELGLLTFVTTNLWLDRHSETRVVVFTPSDETTTRKLQQLERL
jgi:transcriptional regulator with XRE-family HTH domain